MDGSMKSSPNAEGEQPAPQKRRIRGFLINPESQLRYAFFTFGLGLIVMTAFISFFLIALDGTVRSLDLVYHFDPEVLRTLRNSIFTAIAVDLAFACCLLVITVAVGIAMTHRIFGPMVPLQRHVDELIAGRYNSRVNLRKTDEFKTLADQLNRLAETLESHKNK